MDKYIENRVKEESNKIIETNMTIREIAKIFNISKSTVHKDLNERLMIININEYEKIKKIFQNHIEIRHIRGGESTRLKYLHSEK